MAEVISPEQLRAGLEDFWEYICRVTGAVPFKNGDWGRGGRMLIMFSSPAASLDFYIDAERLWATTDPEDDQKLRKPLRHAIPWTADGGVRFDEKKNLRFEYAPSDAPGAGVTKDTIKLIQTGSGLFVGLGEFRHVHEGGSTTEGVVELRKMDDITDFKFAPHGINPAGTVVELSKRTARGPDGPRKLEKRNQREGLAITMTGGSLVIGSGSALSSGPIQISLAKGDLLSLKSALEAMRVSPEDVKEITTVVADEKPPERGLGERAAAWVGKMVAKALTGAWEAGRDVSATILSEILLRYYGLK